MGDRRWMVALERVACSLARGGPPAEAATPPASLRGAGPPHRIGWEPGVGHGFVFPNRVGVYDRTAAERHWERLFSLFARTLRVTRN